MWQFAVLSEQVPGTYSKLYKDMLYLEQEIIIYLLKGVKTCEKSFEISWSKIKVV